MLDAGTRPRHLWSRPAELRLFAFSRSAPRARRPGDFLVLGTSILGLALLAWVSDPSSGFENRLADFITSLPAFLNVLWRLGMGALSLWAGFLLLASLVRWRLDILRDQILAIALALGVAAVMNAMVGGSASSFWDSATAVGPPPDRVSLRMALAVAAIAVAVPHLIRPFRRVSRWLVAAAAASAAVAFTSSPSGVLLGILSGLASAAVIHLVLGSSSGHPSVADIENGLADVGVEVRSLSEATSQRTGVLHLLGEDLEGRPLEVKLYGRDAWDAQLMAKAWRALWFRDAESLSLTRLQQVEHEGFVTLLAAGRGVPTQEVLQAARTADNDALIVLRTRGKSLAEEQPLGGAPLDRIWQTVLAFSDAGLAHGDLAPENLRVDGEEVVLDGLGGAGVAGSEDERLVDLAQTITVSALLAGIDDAVEATRRRLDTDEMARVIPYLQPAALGPRLRAQVKARHLDLDDLRTRTASRVGVDPPEIAKLRRVSPRSLIQAGLLVAVAYFLISTLSGVDFNEIVDALRGASIPILVVALLVAQLPRFTQAESTRAACPRPIAYGPVALLQFAMTFIGLVLPNSIARVALVVRFFQRQGIPPASALSIGVVDSGAEFVVEGVILMLILLFGLGDVNVDLGQGNGGNASKIVWILVAAVVVLIVVVVLAVTLPKIRRRIFERVRPWMADAREILANLRSPVRVVRLFGSNLASELLFAASLALVLLALGAPLPFADVLVINVTVSLFAGIMPVPGGIGVYEAAFTVALTGAGLEESTAFAAAICFRLCTYYLPPIWGWFALHRLEKTGYL